MVFKVKLLFQQRRIQVVKVTIANEIKEEKWGINTQVNPRRYLNQRSIS
ncbi:MAG: hypothetical protein ACTS73_04390 [Arsenophonus sp. NEOnobi-MAG3]